MRFKPKDLGVGKIRLMTNNPLKISGLSGYGLEITSREPIILNHNEKNEEYLRTKQRKDYYRNVHKSAINGLILSGAMPIFMKPYIDSELGIANGN